MARASKLYVVTDMYNKPIGAGFTVKHECQRWLRAQPCIKYRKVISMSDGGNTDRIKEQMAADFIAA
ncbi:hypothetical protein [Rhizobium phage RHph_X3_9]|nr:hypothetical protein [Rhizobium phage RHph_X3_9]